MVVGNGLLAKAFFEFTDDSEIIIFASGVSNSQEIRESEFLREEKLLLESLNKNKKIIYFSTCSIEDRDLILSPYVLHKLRMEKKIATSSSHLILRLPQVVGQTNNPHTLTNFIYNSFTSGSFFEIWRNAKRNLIDIDDVSKIGKAIIGNSIYINSTISIAYKNSISMADLVKIFEDILQKPANCKYIDRGSSYYIDGELANKIADNLGLNWGDSYYYESLMRKYYGQ